MECRVQLKLLQPDECVGLEGSRDQGPVSNAMVGVRDALVRRRFVRLPRSQSEECVAHRLWCKREG